MYIFVPKLHIEAGAVLALTIDGKLISYADALLNIDSETLLKLDNKAAEKIVHMDIEHIPYGIEV
jgi:hypothetical protein